MNPTRNHKMKRSALTAVLGGLILAAVCWADTGTTWPDPTGPTQVDGTNLCVVGTGTCPRWDTNCHQKGDKDWGDNLFVCGNTEYPSVKVFDTRPWGQCQSRPTGTCTQYAQYPCVYVHMYPQLSCLGGAVFGCDYFGWTGNPPLCMPGG